MSKNKYYFLPDDRFGVEEPETAKMVRPGFKLLKVFDRVMAPVINPKTGRQLVEFFETKHIMAYTNLP